MKKLFIFAAAIATLASCSKNEVTSIASAESATTLSFENVYGRLTRAANSVVGDNAYVMGRLYATDAEGETGYQSTWYLEDGLGDDEGAAESTASYLSGYSYYWPLDVASTLDFIAFAPCPWSDVVFNADGTVDTEASVSLGNFLPAGDYYNEEENHTYQGNEAGSSPADGYIKFTFMSIDGNAELTAATTTTYNNTWQGDVPLVFTQLLSKLSVKLVLDSESTTQGYTIEGGNVAVTVPSRRGIFEIDIDKPYENYLGEEVCYNLTLPSTTNPLAFPAKDATSTSTETTNIVPQQASGITLTITDLILYKEGILAYDQTVANTDASTGESLPQVLSYTIKTADIEDNMFHEGIKYWISLEIGIDDLYSNEITFSTDYSSFDETIPGTLQY